MPGAITALVAMAVGGVTSVFHLGHPFRTYNIVRHLGTNLGREMLFVGLTGLVILTYIIMLGTDSSDLARIIVAIIGLVLAVVLGFDLGSTYILPGRPAWNTWFLPFVYAASAAVMGLFTMYVWAAMRQGEEAILMGINKATLIALVIQTAAVLAYMIFLNGAPYADPLRKPARLSTGDIAVPFWGGVVLAGLLIPMGLTIWAQMAQRAQFSLEVAVVGLVCVLVGGVATRALMYTLGSRIDLFS